MTRGDIVMIGDTTGHTANNQELLTFDRWDTLAGPTYRMYFQQFPNGWVDKSKMMAWSTGHASWLYNADSAAVHHVPCGGKNLIMSNLIILNGELRISSFENVLINNCIGVFEAPPRMTADTYSSNFLYGFWSKNILINNCVADGWHMGGQGYGFAGLKCYNVRINNFTTFDCKHPVTATNVVRLEVTNSSATASDSMRTLITTLNAYSTHPGCYYTKYENCYVEGYDIAFYFRSENMDIINCKSVQTPGFAVIEKHRKKESQGKQVRFINNKAYDCRVFADVYDLGNVQRLDMIDNQMSKRYQAQDGGAVVSVRLTTNIDTLVISGGTYDARGLTGYDGTGGSIIYSTQDTSQFNLDYVRIHDAKFIEWEYGLRFDNPPINFEMRDCELEDIDKVIVTTSISNTGTEYQNFSWIGNKITDADAFHESSGASSTISNWLIKDNVFDDVSQIVDFSNVFIDTVKFIKNEFTGGDSITTMFDFGGSKGSGGLIYFMDNNLYDITRNNIFDIGNSSTGTGYIPKVIMTDNKMFNLRVTSNILAMDSTWVQSTNNLFELNWTGGNHYGIRPTRSVFDFRDNDIYINNATTQYFIRSSVATDSTTIGGNTFTGTGTGHYGVFIDEGALIWIPTNYFKGCTIDTIGATHYDSVYVNY